MFLEATDFVDKPYGVPNQEESAEFVAFIERWETKLLKQLLGLDLYNEFIEALNGSGDLDEKWSNLQDGAEYTYNSKTYEYVGIVEMLRPAIYSEWIKVVHRRLTTSGVIVSTGQERTTVQDPTYEIVTNWNETVRYSGNGYYNTLYGFLMVNSADYDNLDYCPLQRKNQFDI